MQCMQFGMLEIIINVSLVIRRVDYFSLILLQRGSNDDLLTAKGETRI